MSKKPIEITAEEKENAGVLLTTCYDCKKLIKVEYYDDNFETSIKTFFGQVGTETVHYCPYCGRRSPGFSPDDPSSPMIINGKVIRADDDYDDDYEDNDDEPSEDSWWPRSEGLELNDEDDEAFNEIDEEYNFDLDEKKAKVFQCPSCNERFRIDPKGQKKLHCLYCGAVVK